MDKTLAIILIIALTVAAIGVFLYENMWKKTSEKSRETDEIIDKTDPPKSISSFNYNGKEYSYSLKA